MASPQTLATGSIGATAAGAGLSAGASIFQGMSQSKMYNYQAGVALMNRDIALQNRDYALATGENEAVRYGMKGAQERGALTAAQGASGVDVGSGSAVAVRKGEDTAISMDLATIRRNAARVAYGFSVEATQDEAQSQLDKMAASNAKTAGFLNASASLVSGAGSVSDKWLKAQQMGIPGF